MATNFRQAGDVLHYTVPTSAVIKSGDVVVIGAVAGIAVTDGVPGRLLAVSMVGVYTVPAGSATINQGAKVYWNTTAKEAVPTTGDVYLGVAWEDKVGGVVPVKLG